MRKTFKLTLLTVCYLSYDVFKRFIIEDKTTINVKSWHQMDTRVTQLVLDTRLVLETRLLFETRLYRSFTVL